MFDQMKKLAEMKKKADKIKKELDQMTVQIDDVKGVKIVINGAQNFKSIEIDEDLLKAEHKQRAQETLLKGVNKAIAKSQEMAAKQMRSVLPGLPGM